MSKDILSLTTEIQEALREIPPKEEKIIKIVKGLSSEQRLQLRANYKATYKHPIQNDMTDKLSYKFREVLLALFDSPYELDARELYNSIHSLLIDENTISEIFASRGKEHLKVVDFAYNKFYGISLAEDIKQFTKEEYYKLLLTLKENERPLKLTISDDRAKRIAKEIKSKGIKEYEKNLDLFKYLFCDKSRKDLIKILRSYNELFGESLINVIKRDLSNPNRKLLKYILFSTVSPAEFFSKRIFKALQGLGTDIRAIARTLIFEENDLDNLKYYYQRFRKIPIYDDVKGDTTEGNYGELLCDFIDK